MRCVLALLFFLLSASASAQDPAAAPSASAPAPGDGELERARVLFQRGVTLADQGQYAAAAQRFREALAIREAPAVAYNLAAALFELRQYDESFNLVQRVLRDPTTNEALRPRAEQLEHSLYAYVARLTVTASGADAQQVRISMDGEPLTPDWVGVPRAVAAGKHQLSAQHPGGHVSEREVDVPAHTAVIIDLNLIAQPQTSAASTTAPSSDAPLSAPAPKRDEGPRRRRIRLWSGIAAAVVAVGGGVALGLMLSRRDTRQLDGNAGDFAPGVLTWK